MINFEIKGAIFDIDDTILDNKPGPTGGLHEKARLKAVHKVGKLHNIPELLNFSALDNVDAFRNAPVHTLEAAVWRVLTKAGIADSDVINLDHPLFKEIILLKNEFYKDLLLNEGEEVPGATAFVKALAANGLEGKLAIASTAIMRDIKIFLNKTGLKFLFPDKKIKSRESINHPKPNPEVFNLAFSSLNLPEAIKEQVCAFEDDPRGIMSAKSAGLFTCAITTRYSKKSLLSLAVPPDLIAESYHEFAELFNVK